jgi:hypothetical protein
VPIKAKSFFQVIVTEQTKCHGHSKKKKHDARFLCLRDVFTAEGRNLEASFLLLPFC